MHSITLLLAAAALFGAVHATPVANATDSPSPRLAPELEDFVSLEAFNSTLNSTGTRANIPLYMAGGLEYPGYVFPEVSKCGDATFGDTTNGASPLVKDCEELLGAIGRTTNWVLQETQWGILVHRGSCAFAAQVLNGRDDFRWRGKWKGFTWVGGRDVYEIVRDCIAQFAKDGRVSAVGNMPCECSYVHHDGGRVRWELMGY